MFIENRQTLGMFDLRGEVSREVNSLAYTDHDAVRECVHVCTCVRMHVCMRDYVITCALLQKTLIKWLPGLHC